MVLGRFLGQVGAKDGDDSLRDPSHDFLTAWKGPNADIPPFHY